MNKLRNLIKANANRGTFKAEANTIYLYDVIVGSDFEAEFMGGIAPSPFIAALKGMTGDVHLRINSPGGDVFGANAMAQAMREYNRGQIVAHVDGIAASAASVLAVTANRTVMAPGSLLMIHNAWTLAIGNRHDLLDTAALLEKIDGMLAQTYAVKSGGKVDDFAAMMDAETWFTPEEALAANLANEIAGATPNAMAAWDLSVFDKVPQAAAPLVTRTITVTETTEVTTETTVETETVEVISGDPAMSPDDAANEIENRKRRLAARLLETAA